MLIGSFTKILQRPHNIRCIYNEVGGQGKKIGGVCVDHNAGQCVKSDFKKLFGHGHTSHTSLVQSYKPSSALLSTLIALSSFTVHSY